MPQTIAFINPFGSHRARVPALDVLVVDVAGADRERLCTLLRMAGHRVTTAERASCALDVLRGGATSIAMIGCGLRDMTLPAFADQVHALPLDSCARPHLVALVPVTEAVPSEALGTAGIPTFLATPVAASRLLELLDTLAKQVAPERLQPNVRTTGRARTANLDPTMLDELAALGLGPAFEREFIDQCLADLETAVAGLIMAARELNWHHMRDYALGAKGVASSVGLVRVAALADSIVKAQDWLLAREAHTLGERMRDAMQEAQALLRDRSGMRSLPAVRDAAG